MEERLLNVQEVAFYVGSSVKTVNTWYRFKAENPENEYSWLLPEFIQMGARQTRYWKESDIEAIKIFKASIPQGRNGILGSVTQKYVKKDTDKNTISISTKKKNGKKSTACYIKAVENILNENNVEKETVEQIVNLLNSELAWKLELAM